MRRSTLRKVRDGQNVKILSPNLLKRERMGGWYAFAATRQFHRESRLNATRPRKGNRSGAPDLYARWLSCHRYRRN
jgi:hypothetical protein